MGRKYLFSGKEESRVGPIRVFLLKMLIRFSKSISVELPEALSALEISRTRGWVLPLD